MIPAASLAPNYGGGDGQRRGDGAHEDERQRRGGELPVQQRGKETLPEGGEGRPLSPAASSGPNYGGGNEGHSANSPRSGEEVAPTKTGTNDREENSLCSSGVKKLSPMGGRAGR